MHGRVIEQTLRVVIAQILKNQNYSKIEHKGIEVLTNTLLKYLIYTCYKLKDQCESSHRTSPTLVDSIVLLKDITELPQNKCQPIAPEIDQNNDMDLEQFVSEICMHAETPTNYYDFLPKFPPMHTYKSTQIKRCVSDDKAQKARMRNEQISKVVENLFYLSKRINRRPTYANYLSKSNEENV
ncbi:hypothetical protein NEOKW01_1539 [Nematocida sp. AWRm80]|nr:hypothetical protein NEOKW01_1539 [Nematocida sp. AWRm80]